MTRLRDELPPIFADDLVAIWLYGGQLAADGSPGDVDGHVVLAREPASDELARVRSLHDGIQRDFGIHELDVWYVLSSEATSPGAPRDVNWHEEARDENWALKRAHWFAGAYVLVFGRPPTEIVPRPDWADVEAELIAQLERAQAEIERSPSLAALSLRLCRIVRTLGTKDVVQSKLDATAALLPELSPTSQEHVTAASRVYRGASLPDDEDAMRRHAVDFYAEVRGLVDALVQR